MLRFDSIGETSRVSSAELLSVLSTSSIVLDNMSTSEESVFVVGATGDIGSGVVRGLVNKGVKTTAYVRDEKKGRDLFAEELKSGHLSIVVGDYASIDVFGKAIEGHSRLFLLASVDVKKPTSMSAVKGTFARLAFEKGVRQIVDLSSFSVRYFGRQGRIAYLHTTAEEELWKLAEANPSERSLVVLRPTAFMSNHFMGDVRHVKHWNKLMGASSPSASTTWIDTKGNPIARIELILMVRSRRYFRVCSGDSQ
jgi:hypothetical protein